MQLGEMLVNEGLITKEQLNEALEIQKKEQNKKIGEILIELGYIDIEKFTMVLDKQIKSGG